MASNAGLRGCEVVVTRPAAQARALARLLESRGATVRVRPLVRIAPPADGGRALAQAIERLEGYDWVVFTSANAVHGCLQGVRTDVLWPLVGCVGEATARAAREYGLAVAALPDTYTGSALPEAMATVGRLEGARVFWPRASGAGPALLEGLQAAGAEVDAVEAYETVQDAAAGGSLRRELTGDPVDLVTFTSPAGVRAFGAGYREPVAVIGSVTGAVALAAALDVQVQPRVHTVEALVEGIERWWHERPAAG